MASNRPSSKWGLSPVNERWFVIQMVAFLSVQLKQFECYNVYKADSSNKIEKMLPKHSFILQPVCEPCNEMMYYNITTTPLPAIGVYNMYKVNPNPNYPTLKYTKGYKLELGLPMYSIVKQLLKY